MEIYESWEKLFDFWKHETPEKAMGRSDAQENLKNSSGVFSEEDISYYNYFLQVRQTCMGASEDDIKRLRGELKVEPPRALIDSLKTCNETFIDANEIRYDWFGTQILLFTLDEIIDCYLDMLDEANDYSDAVMTAKGELLKPDTIWPKEWIPFSALDEMGIYFAIDMRDEQGNQKGQVVWYDYMNNVAGIFANSYEVFFENTVNVMYENGELYDWHIIDALRKAGL